MNERVCHPERSAKHVVEGSRPVFLAFFAVLFLFAACSNYQEEFDNNFGALEYVDDVDYSSPSGGDDPLPSSSDGNNPSSSSFVPTSSGDIQSSSSSEDDNPSSSSVPISSGDIQSSSSVIATSSSQAVQSSSSIASSSSSVRSSSSVSSSSSDYSSKGTFTDPREDNGGPSHVYSYVKYNGLVWMDEDLSYRTNQMVMDDNQPLYSWESAKKACPDGWRLPTIDEFNKSEGLEDKSSLNDIDALKGYFLMTQGHKPKEEGMYWTQSFEEDTVYAVQFSAKRFDGTVVGIDKKILQETPTAATFAVRCVTGSLTKESPRSSSSSVFISRDFYLKGKAYATVTIGGYKWMAENLNYYENNAELIGRNMRCYNNDTRENCDDNGLYYDYESAYAIASLDYSRDNKNIGWTVPDSAEAAALLAAVEKQAPYLWSVEMGGTNQSGFYTLPSGYFRDLGGGYQHQPSETCFWLWSGPSSIGNDNANALCFYPNNNSTLYSIAQRPKTDLYPVRLIYVPKSN